MHSAWLRYSRGELALDAQAASMVTTSMQGGMVDESVVPLVVVLGEHTSSA